MKKQVNYVIKEDCVVFKLQQSNLGFTPHKIWSPIPSQKQDRLQPLSLPRNIRLGNRATPEANTKFTPPPFAVVIIGNTEKKLLVLKAQPGWHLWNFVEFRADTSGIEIVVDFEGHTNPKLAIKHLSLGIFSAEKSESPLQLLSKGLQNLYHYSFRHPIKKTPQWWLRPIYCGWGDQVATSLAMEGPGPESRAIAYCIQGLYERWIKRLEDVNVPIGTVIIDAGWSPAGTLEPDTVRWPDMAGFIQHQHEKNRKVLLWLGTFHYEGIPDKWCLYAGKTKLVVDTTNNAYRKFLRQQIFRLISPQKGCFNADGFKIDQLSFVPSERHLRGCKHFGKSVFLESSPKKLKSAGKKWGCELLYQLQKDIYLSTKLAKSDGLITSSTVHPYFYDTFDMVRLHDTGNLKKNTSAFTVMKTRADLSKAVFPHLPIDTDNWIPWNYDKWLDYTLNSYNLGVPCIFYTERFVLSFQKNPVVREIPTGDLRKIGYCWRSKYIDALEH